MFGQINKLLWGKYDVSLTNIRFVLGHFLISVSPMVKVESFYKRKYRSPFVISWWGSWHSSLFTRKGLDFSTMNQYWLASWRPRPNIWGHIFLCSIFYLYYRFKQIVFVSFLFSLGKAQFSRQVYYLNCSIFHLDYFIRKLCIFGIKS